MFIPAVREILNGYTVPSLTKLATYPGMTGWFGPILLLKLLGRVVVSDMFGQYADRRLILAALDTVSPEELVERAQKFLPGKKNEQVWTFTPDPDGAVWVDFLADLGDGFDSTYAIASLLSQEELIVDEKKLPRGQLLVMGGDEIYPNASEEAYARQLRDPYDWAFPDPNPGLLKGPPVYAIPAITIGTTASFSFSRCFRARSICISAVGEAISAAAISRSRLLRRGGSGDGCTARR